MTKTLAQYYPANGGALGSWGSITLSKGTVLSRYGLETGYYFSPLGTPKIMRAMSSGSTGMESLYVLNRSFKFGVSNISPAFGEMGLGIQYRSSFSVAELRYLRIIEKVN
jgi:hypothetical protein